MQEINLMSFVAVLVLQAIGAAAHWYKMKRAKRVNGTFYDYLVADYPGKSAATGFVLLGAAWLSATSGMADNINPSLVIAMLSSGILHVPTVNGLIAAVTAGYAFDSLLNKGE